MMSSCFMVSYFAVYGIYFFFLTWFNSVYYTLEMEYNIPKTANLYNSVMDTSDCKINVILENEHIKVLHRNIVMKGL
jgi:hypothetical protein